MPLHNIPRKAVSQPKGLPKVARAYRDGLLAVFHAPVVTPDWTPAGTVLKAPASIGLCFESSGTGSRYDKTVAENQSSGFTMLAHFVVRAVTLQDYVGLFNGATYQSLIYVSGGTKLQFFPRNGLGVQAHSKTPAIGDVVSICASADGASYHVVTTINGSTEVVSGTYTGTSAYNNLHIGAKFTGTGSHRTALAAFWKRALPLEQVRALSSKPWRVFHRRAAQVFSNAVAGGALTPGSGTLSVVGNAPDIDQPRSLTPGAGALTLTGNTPVVSQPRTLTPVSAALTIVGNAPSISQPRTLTPGAGTLTLTGNAPDISQTTGVLIPSSGALTLQGNTPSISQPRSLTPGAGQVVIVGNAPTIQQGVSLVPGPGVLSMVGNAPSVSQPRTLTPGAAALQIIGNAPTISQASGPSDAEKIDLIRKILTNRQRLDPVLGKLIIYDDEVTVLLSADAFEDSAGSIRYRGRGLERVERLM